MSPTQVALRKKSIALRWATIDLLLQKRSQIEMKETAELWERACVQKQIENIDRQLRRTFQSIAEAERKTSIA